MEHDGITGTGYDLTHGGRYGDRYDDRYDGYDQYGNDGYGHYRNGNVNRSISTIAICYICFIICLIILAIYLFSKFMCSSSGKASGFTSSNTGMALAYPIPETDDDRQNDRRNSLRLRKEGPRYHEAVHDNSVKPHVSWDDHVRYNNENSGYGWVAHGNADGSVQRVTDNNTPQKNGGRPLSSAMPYVKVETSNAANTFGPTDNFSNNGGNTGNMNASSTTISGNVNTNSHPSDYVPPESIMEHHQANGSGYDVDKDCTHDGKTYSEAIVDMIANKGNIREDHKCWVKDVEKYARTTLIADNEFESSGKVHWVGIAPPSSTPGVSRYAQQYTEVDGKDFARNNPLRASSVTCSPCPTRPKY